MRRCRFLFLSPIVAVVTSLAFGVVACDEHGDDDWYDRDQNEILFGIQQKTDAAGKKEVSAGYEFLGLAHKGGWNARVFKDGDGDGTCYFERYDQRLGQPRVESGVATFGGGKLPPTGLQILANQSEPVKATDGWSTNDLLTFDVDGFAMPRIAPSAMTAPATELTIGAIAPPLKDGIAELALTPATDVGVAWTAIEEKLPTRVMISLETDEPNGPGGNVRCFNTAKAGNAVIPHEWVARLFSSVDPAAPIKGRLEIATHRQLTIHARGSWTVYVVATSQHRELTFNGTRQ